MSKKFDGRIVHRIDVRGMPVVRIRVGDVDLSMSPAKSGVKVETDKDEPHLGVYQVGFRVDNLDEAVEGLRARGVHVTSGPVEVGPGVFAAFIQAPDGVEIELLQLPR